MLTSRVLTIAACFAMAPLSLPDSARALDAARTAADLPQISAADAFARSTQLYSKGDKPEAFTYLLRAGEQGHPVAQYHLARMYAEGDGVGQSSIKAFEYYKALANANADNRDAPYSPLIAKAFVSLASYYMEGIPKTNIRQNLREAVELLTHAASYFDDPEAQYELGRMHLAGRGTERDQINAARWFILAARKGHKTAQATLGDLLFRTKVVSPNPVEGLAWLEIAKSQATGVADSWILLLHEHAFAEAHPEDRERAYQHAETLRKTIRPSPRANLFDLTPSQ